MKHAHRDEPDETRAEIARRRLAQLAASFDAELPPAAPDEPPRARPRIEVPHLRALGAVAVAASVLLVWWLLSGRPESTGPVAPLAFSSTADPSAAPGSAAPDGAAPPNSTAPGAASTRDLIVDVVGKVRRPGIVTVPRGSRVYEAIEAAGGVKGRVDTTSLNLARELTDGEQILVGIDPVDASGAAVAPGATGSAAGAGGAGGPATAKVNLNTATLEQLDTLPGVGPVTAQAILGWREENGRFSSVDDLLDVKGIGEATLAELRDLVVV